MLEFFSSNSWLTSCDVTCVYPVLKCVYCLCMYNCHTRIENFPVRPLLSGSSVQMRQLTPFLPGFMFCAIIFVWIYVLCAILFPGFMFCAIIQFTSILKLKGKKIVCRIHFTLKAGRWIQKVRKKLEKTHPKNSFGGVLVFLVSRIATYINYK